MLRAIKRCVTVATAGVVEVRSDELQPGESVEVIVLIGTTEPSQPLASFVGAAAEAFSAEREADAFIRQQRDEWDR